MRLLSLLAPSLLFTGLTVLPAIGYAQVTSPEGAPTSARRSKEPRVMLTPALEATLKQVNAIRKADMASVGPQAYQAQLAKTEPNTVYDEHLLALKSSLMDNLSRWRNHLIFLTAVQQTKLADQLKQENFTVFVPTDLALAATTPTGVLPAEALQRYVVPGGRALAELPPNEPTSLRTLDDKELMVERDEKGNVTLTTPAGQRIQLTRTDIQVGNGFINILPQPIALAEEPKSGETQMAPANVSKKKAAPSPKSKKAPTGKK